jgi:hypothetical protein
MLEPDHSTRRPALLHACVIYGTDEGRKRVVSEILSVGLAQGNQVRYFADTTAPDQIRSWLRELHVDVPAAERSGALAFASADAVYCEAERFDPHAVIAAHRTRDRAAEDARWTGARICGEMSWALRGRPGSHRLVEYEALINSLHPALPTLGICLYDSRLFDGATIFRVLQTHPYVMNNGQLVENPFYPTAHELELLRKGGPAATS